MKLRRIQHNNVLSCLANAYQLDINVTLRSDRWLLFFVSGQVVSRIFQRNWHRLAQSNLIQLL